MGLIKKLSEELAQKIAAGEVIERPASVVKELVENSLDAQASEIKVELLDGGKGLIKVTDNGLGMGRNDAQICFESHSTSKLSTEEDLSRIATLGFRGEALASISAVSRVTLKTKNSQEKKGTQIQKDGNKQLQVTDIAFPQGTSLEVKDIFFNLPARKKFLSSSRAELSRITKLLTHVAVANPSVRFSLKHGTRNLFDYPGVKDLKQRIYQIYGKSRADGLIRLDYPEQGKRLFGYVSRPPSARANRSHQLFYINDRLIKDNTMQAALNQVYRGFLEKDQFPEAFLFLHLPHEDVDVNVHPTKAEVRFKDSRGVFSFVYAALEQALLKELGIKEVYPAQPEKERPAYEVKEGEQPLLIGKPKESYQTESIQPIQPMDKRGPRVLGQYQNFYIVAEDEEGILIIDQHNAHERVLFDRYLEIDHQKKWPRKLALHAILMELTPSQVLSWEDNRELLEAAGFRAEAMGGQSYALKEYPGIFEEAEAQEVFLALLEDVGKEKLEKKQHRLLSTMACKTAVKAGEPLTLEKMSYLVEELFKTSNTALCPHGRPITLRLRKTEIDKSLGRK